MNIEDRVASYMALLRNEPEYIPPRSAAKEPLAEPAEQVTLSTDAVTLADDHDRLERLATVRRQLAEGSYNISGKDVADKILTILKN